MTRYLNAMKFTFQKASLKQQLVLREFKNMAITLGFTLKQCFLKEDPPVGRDTLPSRLIIGIQKLQ